MDWSALPEGTKEFLESYGFDELRFEQYKSDVAKGKLTPESNTVQGRVEACDREFWEDLPKEGTPEADHLAQIGNESIARGEVGALVLNGGMATRFGGEVKGIVQALPGKSFLALKCQSILQTSRAADGEVPLLVMNSFATDEATKAHFETHKNFGFPEGQVHHYTQGISMRLTPKGGIFLGAEGKPSFYGPGHGDCLRFLRKSGLLGSFLERGGKYIFLSNVDNLAARLDPRVIGAHIENGKAVTAELAPKWPGDQGGAPALVDDQFWIVEGFRFPHDFDQDSIPVFNTNTFTINAEEIDRSFDLTPCYVKKKVDGKEAVQIETLVGEITRFLSTNYLRVRRTGKECRFFPIKTRTDLEDGQEDLEIICS
jgi:UTP--glucose-1-phosphate uridylyltransferase